jgi:hypothetical protein
VRRLLKALGALSLALLLGSATASAQLAVTQADRPGEADPPTILPEGTIQLEGGFEFERETGDDEPDKDTLTVPGLLVRIGIVSWLELQVQADGLLYEFREGANDRALGSDFVVGGKLRLFRARGLLPLTSLRFALSIPVGSAAATSDGVDPALSGLYQWNIGEQTAVVLNTGFSAPTQGSDDDRRIFQFEPRISLERQFTSTIGAFVEYFGEIKTRGVADEHSLDGGFTWLLPAQWMQLDLSGGGGLNGAAPDWFVSAGISMRFSAPWAR